MTVSKFHRRQVLQGMGAAVLREIKLLHPCCPAILSAFMPMAASRLSGSLRRNPLSHNATTRG